MTKEMTKSFPVSKWMVYNSYLKVIAKDGSAGIDDQSIEQFHENLSGNLNKIWNSLASGNYYPSPLRTVCASRKQGSRRPADISMVSDRIAQGVVKDYLEPTLENIFHPSSFGYRPGRSGHDAIEQYYDNCIKYGWVLDVNIKAFFDNINHDLMLQLLQQHTQEKWILLYTEQWMKTGVEQEDGGIAARTKGIPQDRMLCPLFANIYLHHGFDKWMDEVNMQNPFERHADHMVIHCSSMEEAGQLLEKLKAKMQQYELELDNEKTKIVCCKNYQHNDRHYNNSSSRLRYSFQPGKIKDKFGRKNPLGMLYGAISQLVKTSTRQNLERC
jgi:RNA-directed DNA polymerase